MKEVIMHMGLAKTASTSIQTTLQINLDLLAKHGLRFAQLPFRGKDFSNHSLAMKYIFTQNPEDYHVNVKLNLDAKDQTEKFRRELESEIEKHDRLIISGEGISFYSLEDLESIKLYFKEKNVKLRVIIYLRNTLDFLESFSQQVVKSGYPQNLLYKNTPKKIIEKVLTVFPDTEFYKFEDTCNHNKGPVGYFFDLLGLENIQYEESSTENGSLSDKAARVLSYINKFSPITQRQNRNTTRKRGDLEWISGIPGEKYRLRKNEVDMELINSENQWIEEKLGDKYKVDAEIKEVSDVWTEEQIKYIMPHLARTNTSIAPILYSYFLHMAEIDPESQKRVLHRIQQVYFKK